MSRPSSAPFEEPSATPLALLRDEAEDRFLLFRDPLEVLEAHRTEDVLQVVEAMADAVTRGLWAVGFLTYEAAPAFDSALEAHPPGDLPLAWWALFDGTAETFPGDPPGLHDDGPRCPELPWRPALNRTEHARAIGAIHQAIAQGDTYQVNFTFPLEAPFEASAYDLFLDLWRAQQAPYATYLDLGRHAVCSASPELFFEHRDGRLLTRPMKGTARRGRHGAEDVQRAADLAASPKDRAENVMIVDMMRNDLGRIARPGSVRVERLLEVETYPTVHQLTSTVSAKTTADTVEILRALFPCASITGAPKVSTSRIIRQLEAEPRGLYTGALGVSGPEGTRLNVAIRTATVDRHRQIVRYGTGGGIVWDSDATREYEECRTKARILRPPPPPFELLETLLWRHRSGYFLLERHLERLVASADYFGYPLDLGEVRNQLVERVPDFEGIRQRVRLTVRRDGRIHLTHTPWPCSGRTRWRITLDDGPTDSADPFLFHKTTHRGIYEAALARHPAADEVILFNERGELTESTRANLVLRFGERRFTPVLSCGLLAGTYRAELLDRGRIEEAILPVSHLDEADEIYLINSLRGWIRTERIAESNSPLPSPGPGVTPPQIVNPQR